jgi:ABC-type dipeptide/oligopeptide/nickel transport system ATPase component
MKKNSYLSVRNLTINFTNEKNPTIYGVSFDVNSGETLALVGESGSGKTLIAESLMRLRSNVIISGEIILERQSILNRSLSDLIFLRRRKVSYIFQEPTAALNPALTIGYQLLEIAEGIDKKLKIFDILKKVGFTDLERVFHAYPHELSGGMQQRAMIALALINKPKLLIADEPTTALDVVLQKQILELIRSLQKEFGFAILLITHDFSLLQHMADYVCVLHRGKIIEQGHPHTIIFHPKHEYTKLLSASILTIPEVESYKI